MECSPHWFPDGTNVDFTRGPTGGTCGGAGSDLWLIDAKTGEERRLTNAPDRDERSMGWCPYDGKIHYVEDVEGQVSCVVRVHPDGTGQERLQTAIVPGGGVTWMAATASADRHGRDDAPEAS